MKNTLIALSIYLLIFTAMFFLSWYDILNSVSIFSIGFGARNIDMIVMVFSFLGILKTTVHIILLGGDHKFSLI